MIFRRVFLWSVMGVIATIAVGTNGVFAQTGACCFGNGACVDSDAVTCPFEFVGVGTSCGTTVCVGACCLPDKQCTEGVADDCTGGTYQGAGSTCAAHCPAQLGAGFTWQGQLKQNGVPVTDTIDVQASLWTALIGGDPVGTGVTISNVEVVNGLFTIHLNFGAAAFSGNERFLQLAVRRPPGGGAFTMLSPRQPITAAPYAVQTRGLFVNDFGSVGIGTSLPSATLDLKQA